MLRQLSLRILIWSTLSVAFSTAQSTTPPRATPTTLSATTPTVISTTLSANLKTTAIMDSDFEVRLTMGWHGRLEIRMKNNNIWADVCFDNWWQDDVAFMRIVCSELGFRPGSVTSDPSSAKSKNVTIEMHCQGYETSLSQCSYGYLIDCPYPPLNLKCRPANCSGDPSLLCPPTSDSTTQPSVLTPGLTPTLKRISESEINETNVATIISQTKDELSRAGNVSTHDITFVADILQATAELQTVPEQTARELLEIVESTASLSRTGQNWAIDANRIIIAMDKLGAQIPLGDAPSVQLRTNFTVLQVWNLTKVSESKRFGLRLVQDTGQIEDSNGSDPYAGNGINAIKHFDTDAAIFLPGSVFFRIVRENPAADVRLSASILQKTSLFESDRKQTTKGDNSSGAVGTLSSRVVSMRVTVDSQPARNLSFEVGTVDTVFQPLNIPSEFKLRLRRLARCVFWDFLLDEGRGAWSQEGCYLSGTRSGKVFCSCNHLTNFAVLMDFHGQTASLENHGLLSLISIIGVGLSVLGLSLTILAFLLVKKLRKSHLQQALFNLALALIFALVIFLVGFDRGDNDGSCIAVGALLHYFILACFLWMLNQGVVQYLLVVQGQIRPLRNILLIAGVLAWSLPAVPVSILLSIDNNLYLGGRHYCWMQRMPFYVSFLGPVALVLVVNTTMYLIIVHRIRRRPVFVNSSTDHNAVCVRASISCFVVMGLGWLLPFLALEDGRFVIQCLSCIVNSMQGFFIFLLFTARDKAVHAYLKNVLLRHRKRTGSSSSSVERPAQRAIGSAQTAETSLISRQTCKT